ncbi:S-adenosyl-L-methionine-dependent methyltransferase-20 [Coleophoma crateriformis]|uniref:S-adenosyl-L-methionine-dependent methyltransferase-20 n=1 Tax=Coleophoma crateriformis TaxID=565419 RepID=A0A3D8S350_9HELO|nr:S-adenosyl-L-methionine-dependent methyltransferase-20 [Coleophoma crateriformis]
MSNATDRFNAEAAAWDSNPDVQLASTLGFQSLLAKIPWLEKKNPNLDVLEIGCGTGILSLMVSPYVRSLTGVDVAEGMITALKLKLSKSENAWAKNILPVYADLKDPDDERLRPDPLHPDQKDLGPRRFDLVISHLVLHHIPSLEDILKTMYGCLNSGGAIALIDFEDFGLEARKFHPEAKMEGVHRHGISREGMKKLIEEAGFVKVRIETAFVMEKNIEENPGEGVVKGNKMAFPFLICMAEKQ